MSKKIFPIISPNVLEALCRAIGDIPEGLSGTDINHYLERLKCQNPTPDITKWKRLFNAFGINQQSTGNSNTLLKFIQQAIHPSRFLKFGTEYFSNLVDTLNEPLSFVGISYGIDGIFRGVVVSQTISDAQKKASTLLKKLEQREVHPDIFKYCKAELLVDNYFHAVFETTKGVADKIRYLADIASDGGALVTEAFSSSKPILIINNFITETDISEHKGFSNLLIGFFGMFRNTTAHVPKSKWIMTEQDAVEIMTIASLCHRKLDKAQKIR